MCWALPQVFESVGILCVNSPGMRLADGVCLEKKNLLQHLKDIQGGRWRHTVSIIYGKAQTLASEKMGMVQWLLTVPRAA